jgi:hypothetical protein
MIETNYGDGDVQVWETFTDNLSLRDGSSRDLNNNMDIVLDIRHNYDLDLQDISELLNFRIAMVPKSWTDQYGDTIRKNGQEISECLNQMLSNNARVDGQLKKNSNIFQSMKKAANNANKDKNNNKDKPKKKFKGKNQGWKKDTKSWKQRNQAKKQRMGKQ